MCSARAPWCVRGPWPPRQLRQHAHRSATASPRRSRVPSARSRIAARGNVRVVYVRSLARPASAPTMRDTRCFDAPSARHRAREVGEGGAFGADSVVHDRRRCVVDDRAGHALGDADAELGFFATGRCVGDASDIVVEAADLVEDGAAERHRGADHVAHGAGVGMPGVGAADHPVELGWKPRGPGVVPTRHDPTADADDFLALVRPAQLVEPVRFGDRVVVEKRHDLAVGGRDARVASAREAARAPSSRPRSRREIARGGAPRARVRGLLRRPVRHTAVICAVIESIAAHTSSQRCSV